MNVDEIRKEYDKYFGRVLEELRSDCAFCIEKTEEYVRKIEHNTYVVEAKKFSEYKPLPFVYAWDCSFCEKEVRVEEVLPPTVEQKEVELRRSKGNTVVFHPEYDAYLDYTAEQKLFGDCSDPNCEFCAQEIDWKQIKEEYE